MEASTLLTHQVHQPMPAARKLLTPGVWVLIALTVAGLSVAATRFLFGLSAVTNLDQQHPWGLWIAFDVATGVALAAGGFTTAALVHVFRRERYHALMRPALLTAMLGYTFVGLALMLDLGRYYNIWHPMLPSMWSPNSVLFEVGMCVMCYLTVLYFEFIPVVCDRFVGDAHHPRLWRLCSVLERFAGKVMFVFVIAGVVLSCLHQSSLGNLMVIAPSKFHDLWDTPICTLLFLLSAIAVGFPMVIVESITASWSLKLKPEMELLSSLSRWIPLFLGVYLAFKIGDMAMRESYVYLKTLTVQSVAFMIEMLVGVIVPLGMLLSARVRRSSVGLFTASLLVVLGVAINRINVFLVAFKPLYPQKSYFPSIAEIVATVGLVACLMLVYRVVVTYLPVISRPVAEAGR